MPKATDLTGLTLNELTVLERSGSSKDGKATWLCRCSCGQLTVKTGTEIKAGKVKSCGHLNFPTELRGQVFGKLTPLFPSGKRVQRALVWVCSCSCGSITEVPISRLQSGHTKSCGCLNNYPEKHGLTDRIEYKVWTSLAERGERPDEWRNFTDFLKDIGPRPTTQHTLHKYDARQSHSSTNSYWAITSELIQERKSLGMPVELGFSIADCLTGGSTEAREEASGAASGTQVAGGHQQASEGTGFSDGCITRDYEDAGSCHRQVVGATRTSSTVTV